MERFKKNKKGEYFVVPFDNSFESRYPSGLKCLLDKWIKKPYSSLEEACEIADNYAKKAFHDGRLITTFAVVKKMHEFMAFTILMISSTKPLATNRQKKTIGLVQTRRQYGSAPKSLF